MPISSSYAKMLVKSKRRGEKKRERETEVNDGNKNGQLRTSGGARKAAWAKKCEPLFLKRNVLSTPQLF